MPAPADLSRSLGKRIDVFAREWKRAYDGNVDALHRTRVSSRRLRELLPVLGLEASTNRKLRRRLRKVTRKFGDVRDFDVLVMLIDELRRDRRYSKEALAALDAVVREARRAASQRLNARFPPAKIERLAHQLKRVATALKLDGERKRRVDQHHPPQIARWVTDARATRRAERLGHAVEIAGVVYAPDRLHDVRIALKKLRYAVEFKAELDHRPASRDISALKRSQDLLGRLHDIQLLITQAREMLASPARVDVGVWRDLALLVRSLEYDCRRLHARYLQKCAKLAVIISKYRNSRPHLTLAGRRAVS